MTYRIDVDGCAVDKLSTRAAAIRNAKIESALSPHSLVKVRSLRVGTGIWATEWSSAE